MRAKIFFTVLIFGLLMSTSASAQTASERLGNCLVQSSTGAQRIILARWIGLALLAHPSVRDSVAVPNQVVNETNRDAARTFTHLISEACRTQSSDALREGVGAFEAAFEVLGEIAMQEITSDADVDARLMGFLDYMNEDDFRFLE
ncbi:hypothetical protein M0534_00265 [Methylonatrum kenyense]|uniref:hypothetical protein n=1 Tax=Methylonatrum kenyense TaxID=455253 RepID=UPI0020BD7B1D|nr:hypothetical protein [Methylonatrum kenyense]MCK8514766.1 hypothetical protein [Methylonatrum kenyense]